MKPLTVLTGVVLGTCLSIAVSLAAVLLMFLLLGDDYPRLEYEFEALTESLAIFVTMTAISAASFYGLVKNLTWRMPAQWLMWAGSGAVAWYFWP